MNPQERSCRDADPGASDLRDSLQRTFADRGLLPSTGIGCFDRGMINKRTSVCGVGAVLFLVSGALAEEGSWPQFRGPNASGLPNNDRPLSAQIGPEKNVAWKLLLPAGHSSPVVVGGKIFLTAERNKHLLTIAVDQRSGKLLWERDSGNSQLEQIHQVGSHAQSSPVADDRCVVSFFGSCGLFCYDHAGKLLWKVPLGPFKNNYGAASSPILVGNLVVLNQDHDIDSFLIAVDKDSGKTVWRTDRGEFPRGFCTPIVWKHAGRSAIVVPGALRVCGYDPANGHELWTLHGSARICNMTPVIGPDGTLYVTEWAPGADDGDRIVAEPFTVLQSLYDKDKSGTLERRELPSGQLGSRFDQLDRDKSGHITVEEYEWARHLFNSAENAMLAIRPGGTGDITQTHVRWRFNKLLPYVPSPVLYKGRLYMIKSGGIVSCVDMAVGKSAKQVRLSNAHDYFASPVIGDGKIFVIDKTGGATVLAADPSLKTLSTAQFEEPVFATPAIVDGRIYLRTAEHLYCFAK
jgi:outer membrane protein assembly factor BamB